MAELSDTHDTTIRLNFDDAGARAKMEGARLGMWNMGETAEDLARRFGVTGRAARQMGNTIEGIAASVPKLASAFGLGTLAVTVAMAAYNHFVEAAKKEREEREKSITSLEGEISGLYHVKEVSEGVIDAKYGLYRADVALLNLKMPQYFADQSDEINRQSEAIKKNAALFVVWGEGISTYEENFTGMEAKEQAALDKKIAELNLKMQQYAEVQKVPTRQEFGEAMKGGSKEKEGEDAANKYNRGYQKGLEEYQQRWIDVLQKQRDAQDYNNFAMLYADEVYRAQAEERRQKEIEAEQFNAGAIAYAKDYYRQQDIENEEKSSQQKSAIASATAGNVANIAYAAYQLMGKHSKAAFEVYKAASIVQAIIDTRAAAIAAYKAMVGIPYVGPVLAVIAAAAAVAMGMAQVKAIKSQQYGGGADVSAGGAGASYNPVTATAPAEGINAGATETKAAPNIYITVEGSVVSEAELGRKLGPIIKEAMGDKVDYGTT